MADWTEISDSALDPDAPLTSELAYAWRDNVIAMGECAVGSPYMRTAWHPYNGRNIGDGLDGRIWSFAIDGLVASVTTPDFVDGYEYRLRLENAQSVLGGGSCRVELYRETSGAFSAAVSGGLTTTCIVEILRPRSVQFRHYIDAYELGDPSVNSTDSFTATPYTVQGRVNHGTAQKILRARVSPGAGSYDQGAIYMDRRRVY